MPKAFRRYYEPFVGAGALFFDLAETSPPSQYASWAELNDSNRWLMDTYCMIRKDVDRVIESLYVYQERYRAKSGGEDYYYKIRAAGPPRIAHERAACFIFLNKTCFNGLWRVNGKTGAFNVPHGKRKGQVMICDEDNLRRVSKALRHMKLTSVDFEASVEGAAPGDFVYFDPPYVPVSASSDFTAYTKEPFGPDEQTRLRDCALALMARGVKVMLSNADVPLVRQLYKPSLGFKIDKVMATRAINSKADRRGAVGEVIIT